MVCRWIIQKCLFSLDNKYFFQNLNSTGISVIFINKSIKFTKKRWLILKYLIKLKKFCVVFFLTHRQSDCNRFCFLYAVLIAFVEFAFFWITPKIPFLPYFLLISISFFSNFNQWLKSSNTIYSSLFLIFWYWNSSQFYNIVNMNYIFSK